MDRARQALGDAKTCTRFMHLGRDAHALTFPVGQGTLMNVVAFVTDPQPWPDEDRLTTTGTKAEVAMAFEKFGPTLRTIIDLLPDTVNKWAVFDTFDHPATTYARGRICIAGDAAHAAAPHHGAGAGFGIEDSAVLSAVLQMAAQKVEECSGRNKADIIRIAFETYTAIRFERAQWLVKSSRVVGNLYEWQDPRVKDDADKCHAEAYWRSHHIWDYNIDAMMDNTIEELKQRLQQFHDLNGVLKSNGTLEE
jgi:salicylate hydroxylase